jgi:hypothetical protein
MTISKINSWIIGLLIPATIMNGLLAGGNVDRALIANPSWHQVGTVAWANFSRHADLGNGQLVYPIMAISGTILSILAAVLFILASRKSSRAAIPILLAAGLMLASLPISFRAAPFMLSLRQINNDDMAALARAFSGFEFWGRLQGLLHAAAFCANIWSLVAYRTISLSSN